MRLFGYLVDASVAEEKLTKTPLDEPIFHPGGSVGCLVLHGIAGTPANVRPISDRLIAAGYTVSAPLIAGHGGTVLELDQSTGEAWLASVRAAYKRLKGAGCTKVFAIGLSLGGVLTGLLAEELPLSGAVLICPPVVMKRFLRISRRLSGIAPFARFGQPKHGTEDDYHNGLSGMATRKLNDLQQLSNRLRENLSRITCPLLIVQAGRDNKVDARSYDILKAGAVNAESLRFASFPDSPHGCTYGPERERVAALVADFVREKAE